METITKIIKDENTIAILVIVIPWVFAILTLFISFWTTKINSKNALLNINKTVLSENRQQWINNLRETVSEYIALHSLLEKETSDPITDIEHMKNLSLLQTKVILMLNPNEEDSLNLTVEMSKISKPKSQRPEINSSEVKAKILVLTQKILKTEWERVKKIK
ncbi:MAG: hypothetical protein RLZZ540_99 [Bacteroidota bacterium]|jgi:hypothetical protein